MRNLARARLTDLPLSARILLVVGVLVVVTLVLTSFVVKWTTRQLLEDAIGDQMIVQARIAAHLVAIAEQAGITPAQIRASVRTS